jgi:DNA-directed RNA polymerase subunit RPC12/RpoP
MFKDKRIGVSTTDGDPFGCIACPECHAFWLKEYVPKYCTGCGTQIAAARGKGAEDLVRLAELSKSKIITCKRCGERYCDVPALTFCFRCYAPLKREAPRSRVVDFLRRVLGLLS